MRYNQYDDEIQDNQFYGLAEDLRASRFPSKKYDSVIIEDWLLLQYERACEYEDRIGDELFHLDKGEGHFPVGAQQYALLWEGITQSAFSLCKSATAKKAMWGAIATATMMQSNALLVKRSAPFLLEHAKWMPRDAGAKKIDVFAGNFSPKDHRLTTLVIASQRMQLGDPAGSAHIRQWLAAISLAPGVLPIRKWAATSIEDRKSEDARRNQTLWWEAVVPFCRMHSTDKLLSESIFFYLPISPTKEAGLDLVKSLPQLHQQQWAYANIVGGSNTPEETRNFWTQALSEKVPQRELDLRLHLALLQLRGRDADNLARDIDGSTAAMLDSLGTYSTKMMSDMLYARWLDQPVVETPELPLDWYDDTTLGF